MVAVTRIFRYSGYRYSCVLIVAVQVVGYGPVGATFFLLRVSNRQLSPLSRLVGLGWRLVFTVLGLQLGLVRCCGRTTTKPWFYGYPKIHRSWLSLNCQPTAGRQPIKSATVIATSWHWYPVHFTRQAGQSATRQIHWLDRHTPSLNCLKVVKTYLQATLQTHHR